MTIFKSQSLPNSFQYLKLDLWIMAKKYVKLTSLQQLLKFTNHTVT